MIHVRIDDEERNDRRRFACGLGPDLPPGDVYFFQSEADAARADCPGCNPAGPRRLGIPVSRLSTRPGCPGYDEFRRIARSWGHE